MADNPPVVPPADPDHIFVVYNNCSVSAPALIINEGDRVLFKKHEPDFNGADEVTIDFGKKHPFESGTGKYELNTTLRVREGIDSNEKYGYSIYINGNKCTDYIMTDFNTPKMIIRG